MSNQQEKEDPLLQALPPLPKRPERGIMLPESHPLVSIGRPIRLSLSRVRNYAPVARSRSLAADHAEPDHDRSTPSHSLYGPSRGRNDLRNRPRDAHDPYGMSRYHTIHSNARTSYPVNNNTTMNGFPACNPLPDTPAFAHSIHGYPTQYALRSAPFEWNQEGSLGQPCPYSNYLQGQPIDSPAATSVAVPTTRTTTARTTPALAPAPVPPTAPGAPATRSTRSRTQKQTSTAIKEPVKKPAARKPIARKSAARKPTARKSAARKPAAKKSTAKRPWASRSGYGILRPKITEEELAIIRPDYGTLLKRKKSFKRALPGAFVASEVTIREINLLWTNRDNGAEERKAYYDNPKTQEMQEATERASLSYEKFFERSRARARSEGFPAAMPLADRFPVISLAAAAPLTASSAALVVAGNAAESVEDQEMVDDDSASSESSFYSTSEDEGGDMDEE